MLDLYISMAMIHKQEYLLSWRAKIRQWNKFIFLQGEFLMLVQNIYNKELIDLRKIICLRQFKCLTLKISTVCRMKNSGAWHALHAIAEVEWRHNYSAMACSVCHAPEIFILHTSANFEKSKTHICSNKSFNSVLYFVPRIPNRNVLIIP